MTKNDKSESVIIPKWLRNTFMMAMAISILASVISALFFMRLGYIWTAFIPFITPTLIALVVFFMLLDKQKSILHRLFFGLLFYEIVNLLGVLVYYFGSYFIRTLYISNDSNLQTFFNFVLPNTLYAIFCLSLVYIYRKKIQKL